MDERVLAHERVTAEGTTPDQWLFVLHGIYGMGRNWKSVARRVVDARPEWGAALVDLREHGGSKGFPQPHTLGAASADLRRLVERFGEPRHGVLGHSFGGKVALTYARRFGDGVEHVWLVDSTPAARPPGGSAWTMLDVLRRTPGPFESRSAAVGELEAEGVATPVAQWISTNLERDDGRYRWDLDLDAIEELLRDFFGADLWDVVEEPPLGAALHVIKAERSSVLGEPDCERIARIGRENPRVSLHRVEGGHWLNADNPEALVDLLVRHL